MAKDKRSWDDRVQERAYLIWEREGQPHGRSDEFWHRAAVELQAGDAEPAVGKPSKASKKAEAAREPAVAVADVVSPAKPAKKAPAKAEPAVGVDGGKKAKAEPAAAKKPAKKPMPVEAPPVKAKASEAPKAAAKPAPKAKKPAKP